MNFSKNSGKTRFKMYKAGKKWLVAGITFLALAGFSGMAVHADDNQATTTSNPATEQVQSAPTSTTASQSSDAAQNNVAPSTATTTDTAATTAEKDNKPDVAQTPAVDAANADNTTTKMTDNKVSADQSASQTKVTTDTPKSNDTKYVSDNSAKVPAETKTDDATKQADSDKTSTDTQAKQVAVTNENPDSKSQSHPQKLILAAGDAQQNGWNADHTQYYRDGQAVTGVQNIDGTYYDFDENHNMVTNNYVQSQWGLSYMFGNDGRIVSGVTPWQGTYYYFDPVTYLRVDNNYVQSQWGLSYMFGNDGRIVSGVTPWQGTYYYFDPVTYLRVDNNYVQSQWGTWYMFGNDGRIVTGLVDWYGSKYYFDENTYTKVTNDWRDTAVGHAHFNSDGILDSVSDDQKAETVANVAAQFSGWGYAWGGNNPSTGFDCSGLTQYAMSQVGVSIPRVAADQYYSSTHISASQAKKGDLVFFLEGGSIIHTGIYLGNGLMIDAQVAGIGIGVHSVSLLASYYPAVYGRYLNI